MMGGGRSGVRAPVGDEEACGAEAGGCDGAVFSDSRSASTRRRLSLRIVSRTQAANTMVVSMERVLEL